MRLMSKILSLMSCCVLITNLTDKQLNSSDILDTVHDIGVLTLGGVVLTAPLVGIPAVITSTIKGSKNRSEFSKNIKKYINKFSKLIKWVGLVSASLCGAELIRQNYTGYINKYYDKPEMIWTILPLLGFPVSLIISLTSWIGQKLTESKYEIPENEDKVVNYDNTGELNEI